MPPKPVVPAASPFWRTALRHLGAALLLVGFIALAVHLLALPVAPVQLPAAAPAEHARHSARLADNVPPGPL